MKENTPRVNYLCNGEQEGCERNTCYKTNKDSESVCRHTHDVRYAKNFSKRFPEIEKSAYWEEETAPMIGRSQRKEEGKVKLVSETRDFKTTRRIFFKGKEGEEGGGIVTLTIDAESITTEQMAAELEHLATETAEKVKKIVASQEALQQIHWSGHQKDAGASDAGRKRASEEALNEAIEKVSKGDVILNQWLRMGREDSEN